MLVYQPSGDYVAIDGEHIREINKYKGLPHCMVGGRLMIYKDQTVWVTDETRLKWDIIEYEVDQPGMVIEDMIAFGNRVVCCFNQLGEIIVYSTFGGSFIRDWDKQSYSCPVPFRIINCERDSCVVLSGDKCYRLTHTKTEILKNAVVIDNFAFKLFCVNGVLEEQMLIPHEHRVITSMHVYQHSGGCILISDGFGQVYNKQFDINNIAHIEANKNAIVIQTHDDRVLAGGRTDQYLMEFDVSIDPPIQVKSARK